ncbi:MAG: C-terminal helicase domain-containing protein, partial [Sulfitobacter sp.]|nr:C-terminal helicase domain-containing protein [Sulfitobacter sp.]
ELVPCFNMLAGWELLPTHYDVFMKSFVTNADKTGVQTQINNADKLANRLVGLVSYADYQTAQILDDGDDKEGAPVNRTRLPKQLPLQIERVEMSEHQYRLYLMAREKEDAEGPGRSRNQQGQPTLASLVIAKTDLALPGVEREGGSTYHARSRAFADFAPPAEHTRPAQLLDPQGATAFNVRDLPADAFSAVTSAKVAKFMNNIQDSPGPIMLYSQFVQMGLNVAARFLENAGYSLWSSGWTAGKGKKFAIISGEVPPEERSRIVEAHNSPDKPIRVILVSKTGSTGLDLVGGREVHILEPYWEKSLEAQVAARYIRLYLGTEAIQVKTTLYIAAPNDKMISGIPEKDREVPVVAGMPAGSTVDECLHARAIRREVLNTEFRETLRRVAIECTVNAEMSGTRGCYTCRPTARPLFHTHPGGLVEDLKLPNPCEPIVTRTVSAAALELSADDRARLFPGAPDAQVRFQEVASFALGYQFFVRRDPQEDGYEEIDPTSDTYVELYRLVTPGTA